MCEVQALLVTLGIVRFSEAEADIMRHALNRGAGHLADDELSFLQEQIATSLLEAIDVFEPMVADAAQRSLLLMKALGA